MGQSLTRPKTISCGELHKYSMAHANGSYIVLPCSAPCVRIHRAHFYTRCDMSPNASAPRRPDAVLRCSLDRGGRDLRTPSRTWNASRFQRAWEILESRHGRAHPDVGAACISLGNLAVIRRRQDEAVNWFRRALGTFEVCMYDGSACCLMRLSSKVLPFKSCRGACNKCPHSACCRLCMCMHFRPYRAA